PWPLLLALPARRTLRLLRRRRRRGGRGQAALEFLPHRHVALGDLAHHRPGALADHAAHLLAELLLLLEEGPHRALEVAAHEALQRVAVETDDVAGEFR